ncbi:MAG TPA: hypothetical protein VFH06_02070 [Candidatus Saccharimonadales bacterium]|nr:hypothetical protein [Candidatus Saccharimonadales bacterium]
MIKGKPFSATTLRVVLVGSLFGIAVLSAVGFSLVVDGLRNTAVDTSKTLAEANNSQNNVQNLQHLQTELKAKHDVVERASSIVAESKSYQYQDQIIKDLTDYANRSGITITNLDFSTTKASAGATTPAAPQAAIPSGVNSTSVSVTLKNPVDYIAILKFINSIEQNLTKMQISKVGLSKDASGAITSDALTIEVFVR